MNDYPVTHFRPGDLGLLENFVYVERELEEMRATIARDGRTVLTMTGKGSRRHPLLVDVHQYMANLASLAVKLRLCPSTRMKENKSDVNKPAGARPWEKR